MPNIRIYPNGFTGFMQTGDHQRGEHVRGKANGWSYDAARRNTTFLYSVITEQLTGFGYALTYTLRDCPPTPKDFHKLLTNLIKRLRRKNVIRYHWVIEYTRRGIPHIHMSVYFDYELTHMQQKQLLRDWCTIASKYKTLIKAQHVAPIHKAEGWMQYQAKHASRGVTHYQRAVKPEPWQEGTGRVWARGGDWPTMQIEDLILEPKQFYMLRRIYKGLLKADARNTPLSDKGTLKERTKAMRQMVSYSRKVLNIGDKSKSQVAGIRRWMPIETTLKMVKYVVQQDGLPYQFSEELNYEH